MDALTQFIESTLSLTEAGELASLYDPEWRSPCERRQAGDHTYWQPTPQTEPVSFAGLENALECDIHPDIKAYYTSYWSGTLEGNTDEGPVSLIQLWNSDDFDRLISNLIGHALSKQRTRSPYSVFFANTDPDSELFLSIENETGIILLEEPGKKPLREVESDISTFLARVEPEIRQPDIY